MATESLPKNLVPILASARAPGDTMTFPKQSLVLSHWAAPGAELQCWALTLLLKSAAAMKLILASPKIRLHFPLSLHLV